MIRRLTILVPLALVVAFGVRFATAQAPPLTAQDPATGAANPAKPGTAPGALKKGFGRLIDGAVAKAKADERPAAEAPTPFDDPPSGPLGDNPPLPGQPAPPSGAPAENEAIPASTQEAPPAETGVAPPLDLSLDPQAPAISGQVPSETPTTPDSGAATPAAPGFGQPGDDPGGFGGPSTPAPTPGQIEEPTTVPGAMPVPEATPPPGDEGFLRTQNPTEPPPPGGGAALPPAIEPQNGAKVPENAASGGAFVLTPDQIKAGPNAIGVTAEVRAPEVANFNNDSTFVILVKNSGPSDASNVVVRYRYSPEALRFVESDPAPSSNDGELCSWQFATLASGSEKVVRVKVHFLKAEAVDHAVTVQFQTAAKARTQVRQPKLRADIRTDQSKVLKGRRVLYEIELRNDGDLAARDVVVHAKLSPGLGHPKGSELIYSLKEQEGLETLAPGDTCTVKLELDTKAMGEQTCDVEIVSPDIPKPVTASKGVSVVEPALKVVLNGPSTRYPDTEATYTLTVTNDGTSAAKDVLIGLKIPHPGGQPLDAQPSGWQWKPTNRTLYWKANELQPKESQEFQVKIRMGNVGRLGLKAGAVAKGISPVFQDMLIDIEGLPDLHCTLSEPRRVLEPGEETEYQLHLRNDGTKDAGEVRVQARFSEHFEVLAVSGPDGKALAQKPQDGATAILPQVDRIPAGGEVTLSVRVKAIKEGVGTCTAEVRHKDVPENAPIVTSIHTRVTSPGGLNR